MKHYLSLLAILLMLATGIAAQPIIGATNKIHNIGDVIHSQSAKRLGVVLGTTGANQVWDYSGLVDSTGLRYDSIVTPANTPYGQDFPDANYCQQVGSNTSTAVTYYYYIKTPGNLEVIGFENTAVTAHYRSPFFSPMPYSYSYDYFYIDSSKLILQTPAGIIDSGSKYHDSTFITGYGTLILPGNRVYEDVLQMKKTNKQSARVSTSSNTVITYHKAGIPPALLTTGVNASGNLSSAVYLKDYTAATTSQYIFNGNGDWSNPLNWVSGIRPPSLMNIGTEIKIDPSQGGSCIINIPVTIPIGSKLIIEQNARMIIPQGGLKIQ